MRTPVHLLSNEQLVAQFGNFYHKWLKANEFDYFDSVEELRLEVLRRMKNEK